MKRKYKKDPAYRIEQICRARLIDSLKGELKKSAHTDELLGCTFEKARKHIQEQFIQGMTWGNHGNGPNKWHIDHIRPCAYFDFTNPTHQKMCFHYTNLQPLWSTDNIRKRDKYNPNDDPCEWDGTKWALKTATTSQA